MSGTIELDWKFADAVYNGNAIGLRTRSGDGRSWCDDRGATHFLPPCAPDRTLGAALRDCLEQTRLVSGEEFKFFFSKEEMQRNKQSWIAAQVANMRVKTYSSLRKQLAWIGIMVAEGQLLIQPTHNCDGRKWLYLEDREVMDIKMPYASRDAEIGAALREAFKRCEGTGRAELTFPDPLPD